MKKTPVYYLFLFLLFLSAKGMGQVSDGKPLHIFSYKLPGGAHFQAARYRGKKATRRVLAQDVARPDSRVEPDRYPSESLRVEIPRTRGGSA